MIVGRDRRFSRVLTSRCRRVSCAKERTNECGTKRRNKRARSAAAVAVAGVAARHPRYFASQPASQNQPPSTALRRPAFSPPRRLVTDCPRKSVRVTVARAFRHAPSARAARNVTRLARLTGQRAREYSQRHLDSHILTSMGAAKRGGLSRVVSWRDNNDGQCFSHRRIQFESQYVGRISLQ